jgi:nucleoid DNA-binding protein
MTKTQFIDSIAKRLGSTKTDTVKFIDGYAEAVIDALKAEGEITLPGLVKITLKATPATPEQQRMNPFTKQMVTVAAKPASKKVKVKAVGPLKKAVG